jgi:hypothetical protein
MNEVISGIRVIKMYAWENAFNKLISKLRRYMYICDVFLALLLCQSYDFHTPTYMYMYMHVLNIEPVKYKAHKVGSLGILWQQSKNGKTF